MTMLEGATTATTIKSSHAILPKYLIIISNQDVEPDTGQDADLYFGGNDEEDVETEITSNEAVASQFGKVSTSSPAYLAHPFFPGLIVGQANRVHIKRR